MRGIWMATGLAAAAMMTAGAAAAKPKPVKVNFTNSQGQPAGTAVLEPAKGGGVKLKLSLENIPFGAHGVHFHEHAACDGPDFKTAGAHFNPDGKQHGFQNPMGHHAGDTPENVQVGEDHHGDKTFILKDLSMDPNAPNSVIGTAIGVHEKADDMTTNPSGNSGNRIACAVVK